ncbi:SDR family oxidoreductase [Hyphomicrobium sp. CS1GBMeth3]|uniref:SDR family oxidoreductase n=1 Tax=Hyphomicrobium sp. CS1GBMeth3 TaxID=1892845 RepID=UPI00093151E7|nr:SDR family oxidoreductase [Hyphomicrobium sp. CS1GBMeth3]
MRILVTGATGLIGSAILARLASDGHKTIALVHSDADRPLAASEVVALDFAQAEEGDWLGVVAHVDAVVNCVGVFQDSARDSTKAVHVDGATRLFSACARAGVRRVIHVSAMGVDSATPTVFSRTKRVGDEALMATSLDWVILRPSVVVGKAAYGGSALFRGLAALPVLPRLSNAGRLQVVQVEDLVETVVFMLSPEAPKRVTLEIGGPEALQLEEVVASYRRWFGWSAQSVLPVPDWMTALVSRAGDFAGWLGWRAPVRSTAQAEMARGATGDTQPWQTLTGIRPRSLTDALVATPVSVQERWFAQLYVLKPLVFGVLSLFWLGTGLISLGPGWEIGMGHMRAGGAEGMGPLAIITGGLADVAIGIGIAFRRTARIALYAGIGISLAYAFIGTLLLPGMWADPLGPMLKIWPIIVLMVVALAIRGDR